MPIMTRASRVFDALEPTTYALTESLVSDRAEREAAVLNRVAELLAMPVRDGYALYYPAR